MLAVAFTGFTSCKNEVNSPGYEFAPDMYRSRSFDYYGENVLGKGENTDTVYTNRLPVKGTIPRGYLPALPTGMGYEEAGLKLKNPLVYSTVVEKQGEALYGKFCVHCHGAAGAGDGAVGLKLPGPPPAYSSGAIKNLSEGKIFYTITFGKNSMGAHASQLTAEERWKLVYYVQKLQGPKESKSDSTKVASADSLKK